MKKHIFIFNILCLFGVSIFSSCNKFLSAPTSKNSSVEIKTVEHLDAILGCVDNYYEIRNDAIIYCTDDYEFNTEIYDANPGLIELTEIDYCLWNMKQIEMSALNEYYNTWKAEYSRIFSANTVLTQLDKVSGDDETKARLAAEAHLIRAYSYMTLAYTYCLPYTEVNKDEMGVCIKKTTSFEETDSRATLAETYSLIESDLEAAASIKRHLVDKNGQTTAYRGNTAAVNAVSARYWLNRNNYDKALAFANKALDEYNVLMDYNTEMSFSKDYFDVVVVNEDTVRINYPRTYHQNYLGTPEDLSDILFWKETYYCRVLTNVYGGDGIWWRPSKDLLSLYEKDPYDLRYKYHILQHYSYLQGMTDPVYDYPGHCFYKSGTNCGPSVAEMYLVKAESLARQNNVGEAMAALNTLRKARIESSHYTDETAANKDEAIKKILNERRREMPFAARWSDIRRLNNNEDPNDDVGDIKRTFYPYTSTNIMSYEEPIEYVLPKDSRKWAMPLPYMEIERSRGTIKQNTY